MPRQQSGLTRRIPVRSRRTAKWSVGPKAEPIALTATGQQLGTSVVLVTEAEATIVRLRGDFLVFLTAATAQGDGFSGAFGVGLVSNEAFNAGQAAVPGPVSEQDWDGWLYHRFFHSFSPNSGISVSEQAIIQRVEIDSKAMRKWSEGYTLTPVVEVLEEGTAVGEVWFQSRVLLKLS